MVVSGRSGSVLAGAVLMLVFAGVAGCAGFRSGTMWAPYLAGTPAPTVVPTTPYEINQTRTVLHEGVEIWVRAGEDHTGSDLQVMLAVVPTSITLNPGGTTAGAGMLEVRLGIRTQAQALTLRADRALLRIGGRVVPLQAVERQDASAPGPIQRFPQVAGQALTLPAQAYSSVLLRFETAADDLGEETVLDLSQALQGFATPLPAIRFTPLRWRYGYT
ncbi:MAG: hypothetical protein RIT14_182 [Pseudomonadota bacterium]|jgi:hypothetical protein